MPELPTPLPPQERTVGQLVGETMRAYGDHFWRALPLGLPLALVDRALGPALARLPDARLSGRGAADVAAYVWACSIVHGVRPAARPFLIALLIYLPFPLLRALYILPAVAWFALVGLAVPAALVEGGAACARSLRARVRARHAPTTCTRSGSLAALVIVVGVGEITLTALLHSMGDASERVALALADVVLSPLLFLGGAMLYLDQAARAARRRGPAAGRPSGAASPGPAESGLRRRAAG